jgi:drug/metabolite transporter (DMT)-like permease
MLSTRERLAGVFVEASPLLGIPVWAFQIYWIDSHEHADYDSTGVFFASGLFMLAAGLVIALVARFASRFPTVRDYAAKALRFQLIALACAVVLVVLCAVPIVLDSGRNYTLERPPAGIGVAVLATGLAFGLILPLIEIVRASVLAVRAFRRAASG